MLLKHEKVFGKNSQTSMNIYRVFCTIDTGYDYIKRIHAVVALSKEAASLIVKNQYESNNNGTFCLIDNIERCCTEQEGIVA